VCFAVGGTAEGAQLAPYPPLPDQARGPVPAGVYIGTGGAMPSTGLDLSPLVLVPYLMNVRQMVAKGIVNPGGGDPGPTCDEILADGANLDGATFEENVDYWKLDPIAAQTFQKGKSFVLVLTGCTNDARYDATKCGEDFEPAGEPGKGNLKARVYEVDRSTEIPGNAVGVQFIHATAAGAALLQSLSLTAQPGFVDETNPATQTFKPITAGDASVAYAAITDLTNVEGVNFTEHFFTAQRTLPPVAFALPFIQQSSFPTGVPEGANYRNGASFTFLALGDPAITDPDAGMGFPNGRAFHYLAFPNDPAIENYQP
jgi:hypothetical protein